MMDAGPKWQSRPAASRGRRRHTPGYSLVQDLWLLFVSGNTDARIGKLHAAHGHQAAFEAIYEERDDPWQVLDTRYSYQDRKYATVMALLPESRRFDRALDLGCGLGTLSLMLAERSSTVLGVDLAQAAVDRARRRHCGTANLSFRRGDIAALPDGLEGHYDLITLMDTLYYLPQTSDAALDAVVDKVADLMEPGGLCLVSNHLFPCGWDRATRLSRRIDRAFRRSPRLSLIRREWHPFFQTTLLSSPASQQETKAAA